MKTTFEQGTKKDNYNETKNDLRTQLETNKIETTTINDTVLHLHTLACNEIRKMGSFNLLKEAVDEMFELTKMGIEWSKKENTDKWRTWHNRHLPETGYEKARKNLEITQESRETFTEVENLKDVINKKK